ncbi:spore coat protein [Priestia megaterium]|nr:spore coat protein [Priestia megaterium]
MSDLKKLISSTFNGNQRNEILDTLVSDVLNRHGITDGTLRNLSPERKAKIKRITSQLQSQINDILD